MPGPGGMSLLDMMSDQPQPGVNPVAGGGNYGTFGLNQWSSGAQAQPYFGGGGGGGPGSAAGGYGGGARQMPPDLAQYFGAFGQPRIDDPRKVAADAGISAQQLAAGMLPRGGVSDQQAYSYPSDRGGFFTVEDLYRMSGTPTQAPTVGMQRPGGPGANQQVYREGAQPVPSIATYGQNLPSTNNWRLLGMGPGWIMRNGFLINTQDPAVRSGLPAGASNANPAAAEHGSFPISVALGTGAGAGFPSLWQPAGQSGSYYWPGATTRVARWGGETT